MVMLFSLLTAEKTEFSRRAGRQWLAEEPCPAPGAFVQHLKPHPHSYISTISEGGVVGVRTVECEASAQGLRGGRTWRVEPSLRLSHLHCQPTDDHCGVSQPWPWLLKSPMRLDQGPSPRAPVSQLQNGSNTCSGYSKAKTRWFNLAFPPFSQPLRLWARSGHPAALWQLPPPHTDPDKGLIPGSPLLPSIPVLILLTLLPPHVAILRQWRQMARVLFLHPPSGSGNNP